MDGTALDPEISSGIDITEYGGFLFTLSNFEPEKVVSVRIHGRLHDSQQTYGIVHLHPQRVDIEPPPPIFVEKPPKWMNFHANSTYKYVFPAFQYPYDTKESCPKCKIDLVLNNALFITSWYHRSKTLEIHATTDLVVNQTEYPILV